MATKPKNTEAVEEQQVEAPVVRPPYNPDVDIFWYPPTVAEARAMDLSRSLANARAEFGEIRKTKEGQIQNRKYMYADHADVLNAIVETLAKYEVEVAHSIVMQSIKQETSRGEVFEQQWMFIKVEVIKGEDDRSIEWPIGPVAADNQRNGANLTYAKRYAISTLLNLAPDEDTDGVPADDEDRNSRRDYRRDRDRSSNFDRGESNQDPDAWRNQVDDGGRNGNGRRRDEGDSDQPAARTEVRSDKVRRDPSEGNGSSRKQTDKRKDEERSHLIAIDSLNSAGNKKSCEHFWGAFKETTKIAADDPRYQEVVDLYKKRWQHFRDEELRQQDPLGAANDEPAHKPEPDVKIEEDHISPDAAMDEIQNLLEAADSIEEYDRILKEHAHLFEAASAFPPDRELLEDIKETTLERLGHGAVRPKDTDTRTQRMEDVEDRDRSENRRPDLGSERF